MSSTFRYIILGRVFGRRHVALSAGAKPAAAAVLRPTVPLTAARLARAVLVACWSAEHAAAAPQVTSVSTHKNMLLTHLGRHIELFRQLYPPVFLSFF